MQLPISSNIDNYSPPRRPASKIWGVLKRALPTTDSSVRFWWHTTGQPLAIMLEKADYDMHNQYAALLFHYHYIINHLGAPPAPRGTPHSWKSYATDDFSPIEYSWTWTPSPHIRYGIEAIGPHAGSISDPYNQTQADLLVNDLKSSISGLDWRLYDFFRQEFAAVSANDTLCSQCTDPSGTSPSSLGLAFEPWEGGIGAKAYFIPVEAYRKSSTSLDIATRSFQKLQQKGLRLPAYDSFLEFMQDKSHLSFLGLAVDCVDVGMSRFKLYARSTQTSFDDVCSTLRTGLPEHPIWTSDLLSQLRKLWYLVLGLDDSFATSAELPSKDHSTAGVLYNFDIQSEDQNFDTTVYIPVRHYAHNDLEIITGLAAFLNKNGTGWDWGWNIQRYSEMLMDMCPYRELGARCGVQTYISVKPKKEGLFLTSYLNVEIYSRGTF